MNNNVNNQNYQGVNNAFQTNGVGTFDNNKNQQNLNNLVNMQMPNYEPNNLGDIQPCNYVPNNNDKKNNKKVITISAIVVGVVLLVILLIILLLKTTNKDSNIDNKQNPTNNEIEGITENQEQLIEDDVVEKEESTTLDNNEEISGQKEQLNNNDSYLPNSDILKKTLGQTSKFDNGISITITNSIKYVDDDASYFNPRFIKVEINNGSNKNFYQGFMGYSVYSTYTKNPVEFIQEDYNYTNFEIVPMYMMGDELKTEGSGCVLRKNETIESAKTNEYGVLYDINYFVLKPGEQTTAYLLCYFREKIEGAEIKTIYLFNDTNKFMYFMK